MIVSSDKEYIDTKRYKRGELQLQEPFSNIACWIENKYAVKVLNVIYDKINPDQRPRLQVCIESRKDCEIFSESDGINFDECKQTEILNQFLKLIEKEKSTIDTDKLFVVFSAFAPIAIEEANGKVKEEEIAQLLTKLVNAELWKIRPSFGGVTFFFFTKKQAEKSKKSDLLKVYSNEYLKLIKQYDEFNYIRNEQFIASFDSKENFDRNFNGSWFAYDR